MKFEKLIILASASPQRADLLQSAGLPFMVMAQDVDESLNGETLQEEVLRISVKKAEACLRNLEGKSIPGRWITGLDTAVGVGCDIYGKPSDREEAVTTISAIQGKSHYVASGITLIDTVTGRRKTEVVSTRVEFRPMTSREIEWYVDTNEWAGAAGGYRIQKKAALFIRSLEGSYHNVVGLPLEAFYGMLCAFNYPFL